MLIMFLKENNYVKTKLILKLNNNNKSLENVQRKVKQVRKKCFEKRNKSIREIKKKIQRKLKKGFQSKTVKLTL